MKNIANENIDIILPYFNSGNTIDETLNSIVSQSYKNFKIIIINNNSSKKHVQLLNNALKKHKPINLEIKNFSNKVSLGANFNRGLRLVKSDYFCIMHADDLYEKDYLKKMIDLLKKEKEIAVFCDVSIINENSKIVFSMKNKIKKFFLRNKDQFSGFAGAKDLKKFNFITAPSMFFNSKVIKNVGFFSENLNYTLDWDYWFRIIFYGYKIKYLKKNLFKYRIHSNQQSYNLSKNLNKYKEIRQFTLYIDNSIKKRYAQYNPKFKYTFSNGVIFFDIVFDLLKLDVKSVYFKIKYLISTQ